MIHPELEAALGRMRGCFETDERCLAMYTTGSLASGSADAFSDIDVAVVVLPEHYAAVKGEMQASCGRLCGPIAAWLPEGEQPEFVNYAFLFESGENLLLCDLMVVTPLYQASAPPPAPHQVLFDKTGVLGAGGEPKSEWRYGQADLSMTLRTYWVYAYLDGKYYRRGDLYKMLYVQYALFLQHVNVFRAFQPDAAWGWWARDVRHLPETSQRELLVYFGATDIAGVRAAFRVAIDTFSRDGQAACRQWDMEYPHAMERDVRAHLERFGVID